MLVYTVIICTILCKAISCTEKPLQSLHHNHEEHLERVKRSILDSLEMTEPPNPSVKGLPTYAKGVAQLAAKFDDIQMDEQQHFMAESANVLLPAKEGYTKGVGRTIAFEIQPEDWEMKVSEARLYFYINPDNITFTKELKRRQVWLRIDLVKDNNGIVETKTLDKKFIIRKHLIGWHSKVISNSQMRKLMQSNPHQNESVKFGFQITCENCIYDPNPADKDHTPFITINGRRRQKRATQRCDGRCCMNELIVDFNAIGWHWVLHPKQFTANYCAGSCNERAMSPSQRGQMSSNTHMLNAMLSTLRVGAVASCCVPHEDTPIQIVYQDGSGAIRSNHDTIKTIHSCRCY